MHVVMLLWSMLLRVKSSASMMPGAGVVVDMLPEGAEDVATTKPPGNIISQYACATSLPDDQLILNVVS